jgi:phosphoribosylformylglycinamidine cyclo-ligase
METRLISPKELANTFNCGIGMILITDPNLTHEVAQKLTKFGETVYELGFLEKRTETKSAVTIENIESWVR